MTPYDVAIAGGGIVGAALACALLRAGLRVALIERNPVVATHADDAYDLRVSAITLASRNLFRHIGAWDAMQSVRVHPIEGMRIWELDDAITFDAADIGEPSLGFIVENRLMQSVLTQSAGESGVDHFCPASVAQARLGQHTIELELSDGRTLVATLLVGADGAQSRVRDQAGIETKVHDYGQKAIVGTVATSKSNERMAYQRFLPGGPLAFLPLDAHHSSIVWSTETTQADSLLALDASGFIDALQFAFGQQLGAITDISARASFPLRAMHASRYIGERLAIVGDAAHRVHPLAGQGLNLGLGDVAALAEVLMKARAAGKDIGSTSVLRRYERWRKGANSLMLTAMNGFDRLFRAGAAIEPLRRRGIRIANKSGPAKTLMMRYAAGLAGDLPHLARP